MKISKRQKTILIITVITAALCAAVFLGLFRLPGYSAPTDRTITDDKTGITVIQEGRRVKVLRKDTPVWELERDVLAQSVLLGDIDHDGRDDLLVLCWKRGRFGKHKPTWVAYDEIGYSQHIFIYRIEEDTVRPRWMASDIGMDAVSWEFDDGVLSITDTEGEVTKWVWRSWGLEKM